MIPVSHSTFVIFGEVFTGCTCLTPCSIPLFTTPAFPSIFFLPSSLLRRAEAQTAKNAKEWKPKK